MDDANHAFVMPGYQQHMAVVGNSINGSASLGISEMGNGANHIGNNEQPMVVVDPHDEEDYLERKISKLRSAYDKLTYDIKLLNLVAALIVVISGNQSKGELMERKRLILSAIVSRGGIAALLFINIQQFRLLRRIRLLKMDQKSLVDRCRQEGIRLKSRSRSIRSEMSVFNGEEDDDLDFRWFAQRAAFLVICIAVFIDLMLSLV